MSNTSVSKGRNPRHQIMTRLACIAWLALAGGFAQAATMSWTNSAGGDVTNAANWSPGLPGPSDIASFSLNAAYPVNLTVPAVTLTSMRFNAINGGPVVLNLGTNTVTLTDGADPLDMSCTSGVQTNTVILNGGIVLLPSTGGIAGPYIAGNPNGVASLILSNGTLISYHSFIGAWQYGNPGGKGSLSIVNSTNIVGNAMTLGGSGGNGNVQLTGGNSLLEVTNVISVGYGANATGTLTVYSGTLNAKSGILIGRDTAYGTLNLLGGTTTVDTVDGNYFGIQTYGTTHGTSSVLVDGSNTVLNLTNGTGLGISGPINAPSSVVISNGTVTSSGGLGIGSASNQKGTLSIAGGSLSLVNGSRNYICNNGYTNEFADIQLTGGSWNTLDYNFIGGDVNSLARITVSNGTWNAAGRVWLGGNAGAVGILTVAGGTVNAGSGVYLGSAIGAIGQLTVSAGSFFLTNNSTLYVGGYYNAGLGTGTVSVSGTGVLEANTIQVWTNCPSTVANNGGIYQYTIYNPSLTPTIFGTISITNGTVSFRSINNADVTCNQGTKALRSDTKMLWAGTSNTFRLNAATNSGTIDQTYTFSPGIATNFARLELINGSTYRNGNVTIGTNGSLYISGGASTISSVLTAAPSSTIEFDLSNSHAPACLLSTTNLYLNNCTLQLDLANPPIVNTSFMIISNTLASQLTYTFAGGSTKQNFMINGTNYLTTIASAGGGTEVVVRTTIPARGTTAFFR